MASPRKVAFDILRRVEEEGAYSSLLLQAIDERDLAERDIALVTELVYGVLRRRLYLDHVLAAFSSRPVEEIDPDLRRILHLGLYQILLLDRIPDHAAVNEAGRMARSRMKGRAAQAAAFVNGVLRAVTRDRSRVPPPPRPRGGVDAAAALAVAESHPEWLVRRWLDRFGLEETSDLLRAQNTPAPVALRVNRRAASRDQVTASLAAESIVAAPSSLLEEFLIVKQGAPQRTRAFARGEFYIQDVASGLVARLAGAGLKEGDRVLDACAAPGGKALALAEIVGERGLVVAADLHPARLGLVSQNAKRMGCGGLAAVAADFAGESPPFQTRAAFDAVVVDAPCTGTGVIRRNPELRYRLSHEALDRLAGVQARLLHRCAPLVRLGGWLVYAVCSIEEEEGLERVGDFLSKHPEFVIQDPRESLPDSAKHLVICRSGVPALVTLPHKEGLDGFFAARFLRHR